HSLTRSDRLAEMTRLRDQAVAENTERKQVEEALRESEERFRGIFNQTIAGIAQTDLTGRFVQVNEQYCQIVGRSAEDLYGLRMQDITHPDDLPRNLDLFLPLVQGVGQPFVIEKRYVRPDGSDVWVSNNVSLICDRHGEPKNVVAVSLDITKRKLAEEALHESEERFRQLAENIRDVFWTRLGRLLGKMSEWRKIRGVRR